MKRNIKKSIKALYQFTPLSDTKGKTLDMAGDAFREIGNQYMSATTAEEQSAIKDCVRFYLKSLPGDMSPNQIRKAIGVSYFAEVNSSSKIIKGKKMKYQTLVLYLLPAKASGWNVCPKASEGCIAACLNVSGRAYMSLRAEGVSNVISVSRLSKTWLTILRKDLAEACIVWDIEKVKREAKKAGRGWKVAVRLNGTSDIGWTGIIKQFPEIQFYDYTKNLSFVRRASKLANWHVTFSYSGENDKEVKEALRLGANVAFPIAPKRAAKELIEEGEGYDMDKTDLRFLDKPEQFGILSVKYTPGTKEGIRKGFLLSRESFLKKKQKFAGVAIAAA